MDKWIIIIKMFIEYIQYGSLCCDVGIAHVPKEAETAKPQS